MKPVGMLYFTIGAEVSTLEPLVQIQLYLLEVTRTASHAALAWLPKEAELGSPFVLNLKLKFEFENGFKSNYIHMLPSGSLCSL